MDPNKVAKMWARRARRAVDNADGALSTAGIANGAMRALAQAQARAEMEHAIEDMLRAIEWIDRA